MKINELRLATGMSQRQFAEYFGIPVGTLRNWEQGIASPPDYVFQMIMTSIRRDKMINLETIKFVRMLEEFAELSKNGIETFENATESTCCDKIFYDAETINDDNECLVVWDACIVDDPECYHHDIVSYYEDTLEYTIRVVIDESSAPYVSVKLKVSEEIIVVEDGKWYFA